MGLVFTNPLTGNDTELSPGCGCLVIIILILLGLFAAK